MSWPTPQDYNEAIQAPQLCFSDPDLRGGTVETTALGLPRAITGAFASVYKVQQGDKAWAVRCFLNNRTSQRSRYERISQFVVFDDLECTVDFHYLDEGIKIRGMWYPCLKMLWVDGKTLDHYVEENYNNPETMAVLLKQFRHLAGELERAGIAHGDLQHGNIMVTADGLRLVDYDALYVPTLAGMKSLEVGHPNYQHPERTENNFDCSVDNFSQWLIHASLLTISIDPGLYRVLKGGDEHLLFKRHDLREPETSRVFQVLLNHPAEEIATVAKLLVRMIWARPYDVPPLVAPTEHLQSLPDVKPEACIRGRNDGTAADEGDSFEEADGGEGAESSEGVESSDDASGSEANLGSITNRYDALFDDEELAAYSGSRFINVQAQKKTRVERWKLAWAKLRDEMAWRFAKTAWCHDKLNEAQAKFDDADYDAAVKSFLLVYSRLEQDGSNSDYLRTEYFDALIGLGSSFGMLRKATLSANYFLIASNKSKGRASEKILQSMFLLALARLESGNKIAAMKVLEENVNSIDDLFAVIIAEEVKKNVFARRVSAFTLVIDFLTSYCTVTDVELKRVAPRIVTLLETAVRVKRALKKESVKFTDEQFRKFMAVGSWMHRAQLFQNAASVFENLAELCEVLDWDRHERMLALLCCAASNNELKVGRSKIGCIVSELKDLDRREFVAVIDAATEYLPVTELIITIVNLPDEWAWEAVVSAHRADGEDANGGSVRCGGDAKGGVKDQAKGDASGGAKGAKSGASGDAKEGPGGVILGGAEGPVGYGPLFGPRLACTYSYLEGGACLEQIVDLLDPLSDEELLACLKTTFLSNASADNGTLDLLILLLIEQKRQRWLALVLTWLMENIRHDLVGRMTSLLAQRHEFKVIDWLGAKFYVRYNTPLMSHLPADVKETFKTSMDERLVKKIDNLDELAVKLAGRGASSFEAASIIDEGANELDLIDLYLSQGAALGQNECNASSMFRVFGKTNARFVSRWLLRSAADGAAEKAAHAIAAERGKAGDGSGEMSASKTFAKRLAMLAQYGHARVFEIVISDLVAAADQEAIRAATTVWMAHGQASHVVSLSRKLAMHGNLEAAKEVVRDLRGQGFFETTHLREFLARDPLLSELFNTKAAEIEK